MSYMYVYSPPNLNKKFRFYYDILIKSNLIDKSQNIVKFRVLKACKVAN